MRLLALLLLLLVSFALFLVLSPASTPSEDAEITEDFLTGVVPLLIIGGLLLLILFLSLRVLRS